MGVCSIQWGKLLQNLAYQWPFLDKLRLGWFPWVRLVRLVLIKDDKYMGWKDLMDLKVIRSY